MAMMPASPRPSSIASACFILRIVKLKLVCLFADRYPMGMLSIFMVRNLFSGILLIYCPILFAQNCALPCSSHETCVAGLCTSLSPYKGGIDGVPLRDLKGPGTKKSTPRASKPPKNTSTSPSNTSPADKSDEIDQTVGEILNDPENLSDRSKKKFCYENSQCDPGYICKNNSFCVLAEDNSAAAADACTAQYESLMQECQTKIEETSRTCDDKNDSGMNNVINGAAQITLSMGQSTASSVQKSCSDMAALTQGANAALAAFRLNCGDSIKTCKSTCSQVKDFAVANNSCLNVPLEPNAKTVLTQRGDEAVSECNGFNAKVGEANTAIQNFTQTLGNATKCETATAANVALSKLPQFCQSQPNYPGCNPMAPVDCTNPAMAANKVCICSKNPMDTSCFVQQKAGGDHMPGGIGDPSSRLNKKADAGFGGDIPDLPPIDQGNPNTTAGNPISGHQGGNGGLGGGDSGSGGPPGTGGSGGSGSDSQASGSGFYGSNGSGGYGAGGGYNGGSGNGGRYTAGAGPAGAKAGAPDLRKFLPGGQYDPRRGLSGMTGPDGITGPHSDIWRKVQNRYQVVSPELLP